MKNINFEKKASIIIFLLFSVVILGATLYYSPGWGFMDDYRNLPIAQKFWQNNPGFSSFKNLVAFDISEYGRFRPIYQIWVVFAYHIFFQNPLGLYILIAVFNILGLLLWGLIIHKVFSNNSKDFFSNIFIYPLTFFIFTPFWNNFMYISLLEKFVYIFSAISLYFFISAYRKRNFQFLLLSLSFAILCILSKETGVALFLVYWVYSLFNSIFSKDQRRFSLLNFSITTIILFSYYLFIKGIWSGYSSEYGSSLSPMAIFMNIMKAPFVIKGLAFFSAAAIFSYLVLRAKNKSDVIKKEAVLFPLFLGSYIVVLSPWRFSNYLLAPIAPLIMATLYPLYRLIGHRHKVLRLLKKVLVVVISFLILFLIIIPRISKMADKRKLVEGIKSIEKMDLDSRYFFPPPFRESFEAIREFTGADVEYLAKGTLSKERLSSKGYNYLIFGDQCSEIALKGVAAGKEVYNSNTWKIFLIKEAKEKKSDFIVVFPENFAQRLKNYLKEL